MFKLMIEDATNFVQARFLRRSFWYYNLYYKRELGIYALEI